MSTLSIKIGAILDGSFNTVMKGSSGQLTSLGKTIRELDSSLRSVSKFKQLRTNFIDSKKSWMDLTKQTESLAKEIQSTSKPTKALLAQFNNVNLAAIKAKETFLKKRDALRSISKE